MTERLRILMVMAAMPYPPIWGTGLRNYELLRYLSNRHDVTLLTYRTSADPASASVLEKLCARVIYVPAPRLDDRKRRQQLTSLLSTHSFHSTVLYSSAFQAELDRACSEGRYDVIQVEQSTLCRFRVDAGTAVVVLDEHNIEFEILRRNAALELSPARKLYSLGEFVKHRREEVNAWRSASGCTVTSAREQEILRRLVPGKPSAVVMNSVDTDYFRPSAEPTHPGELVFTGLMRYRPNVDAVCHFVRTTLPQIQRARPGTHLTIVGAGPPAEVMRLASADVEVTGTVPDVRPYLWRAAVVVVPIRTGGGTRFKVAEGLAMGKAVVATSIGAEGIGVRHEEQVLLADDPPEFARQVVRVLEDRQLARALGVAGRAFAERHLSWQAAGGQLEALYRELRDMQLGRHDVPVAMPARGHLQS